MPRVDRELILRKAKLIEEDLARLKVYNSIQEHSAIHCGDELNADMSSSFGGIPRSLERGGCHKNISLERYLENFEIQLIVERLLEKITGRLIDVNYHILREEYEIMPEDYYNSFIAIGKNKIVTEEFAASMAKSVGLRNVLAHEYEKINQELIHGAIKIALSQVPEYIKKIVNFVEK